MVPPEPALRVGTLVRNRYTGQIVRITDVGGTGEEVRYRLECDAAGPASEVGWTRDDLLKVWELVA